MALAKKRIFFTKDVEIDWLAQRFFVESIALIEMVKEKKKPKTKQKRTER